MADFDKYIPILSKLEGYGKFTNVPGDKGSATMSGVTLATFRSVYGSSKTENDLKNMSYDQWHYIMKSLYWEKVKAQYINNQSIALLLADFAVNSGVKTASKKVQELLGEETDGIIGPLSLRAINTAPQELLFNGLKAVRENYYRRIVDRDSSQKVFLKGWLSRLAQFSYSD